jgi:hypothetical protein
VTKDKKKPEVFDFNHEDGIASQMSDKQIEGIASSLNKLMDKKMREDPEMKKRIEARRAERLARKS